MLYFLYYLMLCILYLSWHVLYPLVFDQYWIYEMYLCECACEWMWTVPLLCVGTMFFITVTKNLGYQGKCFLISYLKIQEIIFVVKLHYTAQINNYLFSGFPRSQVVCGRDQTLAGGRFSLVTPNYFLPSYSTQTGSSTSNIHTAVSSSARRKKFPAWVFSKLWG